MADEIKLNKDVTDGKRADLLLRDDTLRNAFFELEQSYIAKWRSTEVHAEKDREKLWLAVQVVGKVRDHLAKLVNNGKLAQRDLDELAAKRRGLFRVS